MRLLQEIEPPMAGSFFAGIKLIDRGGGVVANIVSLACGPVSELRLRMRIASAVHDLELTLFFADGVMRAELDKFIFDLPTEGVADFRTDLCRSASRWGNAYASASTMRKIETWLQVISPPCRLSYLPSGGFYCALAYQNGLKIKTDLMKLRARIMRWQRQPYLIMRRLALTLELANIVVAQTSEDRKRNNIGVRAELELTSIPHLRLLSEQDLRNKLANFCRVLRNSYVKELPLVFTSDRWQSGLCVSRSLDETISVARFGLERAYEEIYLFRKLFEQTSHMGDVSVMIARKSRPGQKFWLTLTPSPDVTAGVIDSYHRILATHQSVAERRNFCWHPVFSETSCIKALAQAIGLISCPDNVDMAVGNYFVESITSETEFAISNGMSKFLLLPPGTYSYIISHLPNYYLPSSTTAVSRGYIKWQERKRNKQLISAWVPTTTEDKKLQHARVPMSP